MKFKRGYIWIISIITCLLCILAMPAYHKFKVIRSRQLTAQAKAYSQEKNWVLCMEKAKAAFKLNPKNADIRPLLEDILLECNAEEVFALYDAAFNIAPQSTEANEHYIEVCVHYGLHKKALECLKHLSSHKLTTPKMYQSVIKLLTLKNKLQQVEAYIEEGYKSYPTDETLTFQYAQMLLNSGIQSKVGKGRELLWGLAESKSFNIRLNAASCLLGNFTLGNHEKLKLQECLHVDEASSSLKDRLAVYEVKMELAPLQRQKYIESVIEQLNKCEGDDLVTTARWLRRYNQLGVLIDTLPQKNFMTTRICCLFILIL